MVSSMYKKLQILLYMSVYTEVFTMNLSSIWKIWNFLS